MNEARVLADSVTEFGVRLTTLEITMPRCVLAEFNTHRVFSRNSASSRAIPFSKQLARVNGDPFIPPRWGKNQKGMQANEELDWEESRRADDRWLITRDAAVMHANSLYNQGVHKQDVNRLLEPFMWHTAIVSSTEWDNFLKLRCPDDTSITFDKERLFDPYFPADTKIQPVAYLMKKTIEESNPIPVFEGEWHLPLWNTCPEDQDLIDKGWGEEIEPLIGLPNKVLVSVGRCARVSYLTHDGQWDPVADVELSVERLSKNGHWSPWEHVATPMSRDEWILRQRIAASLADYFNASDLPDTSWEYLFCGNFKGWRQARKFFLSESGS